MQKEIILQFLVEFFFKCRFQLFQSLPKQWTVFLDFQTYTYFNCCNGRCNFYDRSSIAEISDLVTARQQNILSTNTQRCLLSLNSLIFYKIPFSILETSPSLLCTQIFLVHFLPQKYCLYLHLTMK